MYGYSYYDHEYDRCMAQYEDILAYAAFIGIDPEDDSEPTQSRLMAAWQKHCDEVYQNEQNLLDDNKPCPSRPNLATITLSPQSH